MLRVTHGTVVYYHFKQWAQSDRIVHGVMTRLGGYSKPPWASLNLGSTVGDDPKAVRLNHRLVFQALGLDGAQPATVWQVHGSKVIYATAPPQGRPWLDHADAMITDVPGLPLIMRFADCIPILLYDPVKNVIGIAHAGWKGTIADVAGSTVRAMADKFGSNPGDIEAGIGPGIGPECYEVGEEVVAAVENAFVTTDGLITRDERGKAHFDLWAANRLALERAGVVSIEVAGICTACHTDEFYSHRAEHGRTGRFGAVIALRG